MRDISKDGRGMNLVIHRMTATLVLIVSLIAVVGCNKRASQDASATSESCGAVATFDASVHPGEQRPFLIKLNNLIERYNSDANGISLSEHGVNGQLEDAKAKEMAEFANSILKQINNEFDKPVSRIIGESWYQVPSRFKIEEAKPHDGTTATFTVSHHNCGLHEFDFVVANGKAHVVADRYDTLGIMW